MLTAASTRWLALAIVILVCCPTGVNALTTCNETYISKTLVEVKTPTSGPETVTDLATICPNIGNDKVTLNDRDTDGNFEMANSILKIKIADAEAVLSTNKKILANPWTIIVHIEDADGNFTEITVFVSLTSLNDFPAKTDDLLGPVDILRGTAVGTVVTNCTLEDGDYPGSGHDIPYIKIFSGNDDNKFAVDMRSCAVTLINTLIDSTVTSYKLTFKTYNFENDPDEKSYDVTFKIVPDNKYPPKCVQFSSILGVNEGVAVNPITKFNCTTYDGLPNVGYFKAAGSPDMDVNNATGEVSVTSGSALKYDNVKANNKKQIVVTVAPKGKQSPTTTVVAYVTVRDLDDNIPQMPPTFTKSVQVTTLVGTNILNLTATDADAPKTYNSQITFGFAAPCTPDSLLIDGKTGSIYLNTQLDPTTTTINCQATAFSSDKSTATSTTFVVITVIADSNKPPVFSQFSYSGNVTENSMNGASVLTVSATGNGPLTYTFSPATSALSDWPFMLQPTQGVMSVATTVDYELQDTYNGSVIVTDSAGLTAIAYVGVHVQPENEFPPAFQPMGAGSANKYDEPGTTIATITALDKDKGPDRVVQYKLTDPTIPFVLESQTGILRIGAGLAETNVPYYDVDITATDMSKVSPKTATTTFRVNIQTNNRNNNDPECSPLGPLFVRPKSPNVGDPVGDLQCTDADPNTILYYNIIGGDTYSQFEVTFNGTTRLKFTPIAGSFMVMYSIRDNGSPSRSTTMSVLIHVQTDLKINNLPATIPVFENSNVTDIIFTVVADGSYEIIKYEITKGNTLSLFNINQMTGDIRLTRALDRDTISVHSLEISASASGQTVKQTLKVNVQDKNDNKPRFASSLAYVKINDTQNVPSVIGIYSATDLDILENAQIDYSLISGDPSMFKYTSSGGLSLIKKLDYATTPFYTLVLQARDRGSPFLETTMTVNIEVVHVSDNKLVIVQSGGTVPLTLPENSIIGSAVAQIKVQNNDSSLNFTITSGNSANDFYIVPETGVVYLVGGLDRESVPSMNIGIRVTNAIGKTDDTTLAITITDYNDNDPFFNPSNYVFFVSHGTGRGRVVGAVAVTDADLGVNSDLTLSVISGDPNGRFVFNGKTLTAAAVMDANVQNSYDLEVLAADHGNPSLNSTAYVSVFVRPALYQPLFVPKAASKQVREDELPGTLLYDADAMANGSTEHTSLLPGDLVYNLTIGDPATFFLESDIGVLQLIAPLKYSVKVYNLVITASNKYNLSLSDTFTLVITVTQVNRYPPVFYLDTYFWNIAENTPVGTNVGRVNASDKDPGQFGVITFGVEPNKYFQINPTTGVFTLTSALDYSIAATHNLRVTATDNAGVNSKSTTCLVFFNVTDINNHYPNFTGDPYAVTVPENLPAGTVILFLYAEDLDSGVNGTVTYSIISGDSSGIFNLDPLTGALSLGSSLDFESAQQHMLVVEGKDGGKPSLSNTTVVVVNVKDENDNSPDFGTDRVDVTIRSDTPALTPFQTLVAKDKDWGTNGIVNYVIQGGNNAKLFEIDTNTGVLKTAASVASVGNSFQVLTVEAIDQGLPPLTGSVTVGITIQLAQPPGNANYDFSVRENRVVGTQVGSIPSVGNSTYTIRGGNYGNAFSILANGTIITNIRADRETYNYYQLLISVVTGTTSSNTTVNIKIIDVNDNAPVIVQSVLRTQVVENLASGNIVGKFTVTDADEKGPNSEFDLYISPSTPPATTYFSIDANGVLSLIRPISYEAISSFEFYVVAKDRGTPSLSSFATVYINVVNITETKVYNYFESAFFVTCDFPDDAVDGDVVCPLTTKDVNVTTSQGDEVTFNTVGRESIFIVHRSTGLVQISKQSFVTPTTCFIQWVIVSVKSGGNTTDHALMVRLDTFNRLKHLVVVRVSTDVGDLQAKKAALQTNLQALYKAPISVVVWGTRSVEAGTTRRRLLASQSEALVVVEKDQATNDVANIDKTKTFLTSAEALQVLQQSSDGTPVASLASSTPAVTSVKPYSPPDTSLDPAYIALIVIGSLFLLALIIALIVLFIYCRYYRKPTDHEKKKLVKKKNQSQQTFGNIHMPVQSEVRPAPVVSKPEPVVSNPEPAVSKPLPTDPDSDGMPVQPTRAVFVSSSRTPVVPSDSTPKKNVSTMLESLEEKNEEDITSDVSVA